MTDRFKGLQLVDVPVSKLVRLSRRPETEPYWTKSATYRFDSAKGSFGVLYAASDITTAFAESILHSGDSKLKFHGSYLLSESDLSERQVVTYKPSKSSKRRLKLADLTGVNLKAIGLKNDISAGSSYRKTQLLADALHAHDTSIQGIRYVSRQNNLGFCYVLIHHPN